MMETIIITISVATAATKKPTKNSVSVVLYPQVRSGGVGGGNDELPFYNAKIKNNNNNNKKLVFAFKNVHTHIHGRILMNIGALRRTAFVCCVWSARV